MLNKIIQTYCGLCSMLFFLTFIACASDSSTEAGPSSDVGTGPRDGNTSSGESGIAARRQAVEDAFDSIMFVTSQGVPTAVESGEEQIQRNLQRFNEVLDQNELDREASDLPIRFSLDCFPSGSVDIESSVTLNLFSQPAEFSLSLKATLNNCDGNSGEILLESSGTNSQDIFTFSARVDGEIDGRVCSVNGDGIVINLDVDRPSDSFTGDLSGLLFGRCSGIGVDCNWNAVDVLDDDLIFQGCGL